MDDLEEFSDDLKEAVVLILKRIMEKEYKLMDDDEYVYSCKKDLYGRLNDIKIEALDLSQKAEKAINKFMKIQTKNDMEKFIQKIIDIDDDLYRVSVNKL